VINATSPSAKKPERQIKKKKNRKVTRLNRILILKRKMSREYFWSIFGEYF